MLYTLVYNMVYNKVVYTMLYNHSYITWYLPSTWEVWAWLWGCAAPSSLAAAHDLPLQHCSGQKSLQFRIKMPVVALAQFEPS